LSWPTEQRRDASIKRSESDPSASVTTCPHCLHTLKNEYPAYGGNYDVIHHTELIEELFAAGKLKSKS